MNTVFGEFNMTNKLNSILCAFLLLYLCVTTLLLAMLGVED